MPGTTEVAKRLAELFKLAAHPDRIRIIENLRISRQDVGSLADKLGLPVTRVSQHLGLLKAHRCVEEQREGRHHYYTLTQPDLADWILEGLEFIGEKAAYLSRADIAAARKVWSLRDGEPDVQSPITNTKTTI